MTDEFLIKSIRGEMDFLASRGMPTLSTAIDLLMKRFETLKEAHRLLAEREERLTQKLLNADTAITVGFASFKDETFELIVRDDDAGFETTLCGTLQPNQLEAVGRILPTCCFAKARPSA